MRTTLETALKRKGRHTWAALAAMAIIAGCGGRDRATVHTGKGARGSEMTQTSGGQISDTQKKSSNEPNAPDQAAGPGTDSGKAGEIARAPRANPNPPSTPRPTLTPEPAPDTNPKSQWFKKYHTAPRDTVSQTVYTGWKYFNLNCARCHGEDVTGTTIAPHLIDSFSSGKVDHAEFWRVVHGSRAQLGMPNWTGLIGDDTLQAIYQYIKARSEGKVHPGRPAVQSG